MTEREQQLYALYWLCFSTDSGKKVLEDLMIQTRFFDVQSVSQGSALTEYEIGRRSVIVDILSTMQLVQEGHETDIEMIVDRLLTIQPKLPEER